jgi:hypothetical protein
VIRLGESGIFPDSNLESYMKMMRSLILGSAAGLIAMNGVHAADLPVKAKAVEYVKVCSLYGAGFWAPTPAFASAVRSVSMPRSMATSMTRRTGKVAQTPRRPM